jgi:hypothetical protein
MNEASISNVLKSGGSYNLIYLATGTNRNTVRFILDLMIDRSIVSFFS